MTQDRERLALALFAVITGRPRNSPNVRFISDAHRKDWLDAADAAIELVAPKPAPQDVEALTAELFEARLSMVLSSISWADYPEWGRNEWRALARRIIELYGPPPAKPVEVEGVQTAPDWREHKCPMCGAPNCDCQEGEDCL